jgi:hypothetical protein
MTMSAPAFQWPGQHGRGESAVDAQQRPVPPGDLGTSGDVGDRQQRIAGTLDPKQPGVRPDRRLELSPVVRRRQRHLDAGAIDDLVKQAVGAAVDVAAGQDVVARLQQHGRAVRGGHAGRERQRAAAAFERSERPFQVLASRVAAARIIELAPLAGARLDERRGQMDRRHDGAGGRIVLVADMDRSSAEFHHRLRSGWNLRKAAECNGRHAGWQAFAPREGAGSPAEAPGVPRR